MVERWARLVGKDHVTVVVVDDTNRDGIFQDFENLLGLPEGALLEHRRRSLNRSMTAAESELLRCLNETLGGGQGWRPYGNAAHIGLIKGIVEGRTPGADEAKLQTPQWALDIAARYAETYVAAIKASGVNVMGDVELLGAHLKGPAVVNDNAVNAIALDAAVAAILGAIGVVTVSTPPTMTTLFKQKAGKLRRSLAGR